MADDNQGMKPAATPGGKCHAARSAPLVRAALTRTGRRCGGGSNQPRGGIGRRRRLSNATNMFSPELSSSSGGVKVLVRVMVLPLGGMTVEVMVTPPAEGVAVLVKLTVWPPGPVMEPLTVAPVPRVAVIVPDTLALLPLGMVMSVSNVPLPLLKVLVVVTVTGPAGVVRVTVAVVLSGARVTARRRLSRKVLRAWAWTDGTAARANAENNRTKDCFFMGVVNGVTRTKLAGLQAGGKNRMRREPLTGPGKSAASGGMNRRGFMRVVGAIGLGFGWGGPADAAGKSTAEIIRQALAEHRVVEFKYHGYERRVEPHALGRVTENRPALLGWQELGGSASEPPPGWRTFLLAEMEAVKLLRKTFTPRADYRPETTNLKPIEAEVAPTPISAPAGK